MKYIHYCWVQGLHALPAAYRDNIAAWESCLPEGFSLRGWDHNEACLHFPFYARHASEMSHHAMRADITLLCAQVAFGGLAIGTDMRPNRPEGLFRMMLREKSFIVRGMDEYFYNGMSFANGPQDLRFIHIFNAIQGITPLFSERQVPAVTGPLRWTAILDHMDHGLEVVSENDAWTRSYWETTTSRPYAWVDPGFAASHRIKQ
jgi:hypothetical protein